jgi:hypothetical protein
MYTLLLIVFTVSMTFFTLGAGLIIVFPINLMFFRIIELILYYKDNNKAFYINNKDVISPDIL